MKLILSCWAILLVFLLCSPPLSATQYYLSPSDDWYSIITGAGLAPGDEVILQSGIYTSTSSIRLGHQGTAQSPITIRAAQGANVVFTHDENHNVLELSGAQYLTLDGIEVTGGSMGIRMYENANGDDAKFITIQNSYIHDTREAAITANYANQTYEGIVIRHNEIARTGGTGEGLYLGSNDNLSQFFNGVIENNYIHHLVGTNMYGNTVTQGDGIEIKQGSYNNIIRNNVIHDVNYAGIIVYGTAGNGDNNQIYGNVIWNTNDNAIQAASNAEIYNNIIFGTVEDGFHSQEHQGAVPGDLFIAHNTIVDNTGSYGIRIAEQPTSSDIIIANNAIYTANSAEAMDPVLYGTIVSGNAVLSLSDINVITKDFFPDRFIAGANPLYAVSMDFNGDLRTILNVGAYNYNDSGNPGWQITEGFKAMTTVAIPEPATWLALCLGIGLFGRVCMRRKL